MLVIGEFLAQETSHGTQTLVALYQLARRSGPLQWWSLAKFFRLGDRGRLFVGGDSRSTDLLGMCFQELAERLVAEGVAIAIDHESPSANCGSSSVADQHGMKAGGVQPQHLSEARRWQTAAGGQFFQNW